MIAKNSNVNEIHKHIEKLEIPSSKIEAHQLISELQCTDVLQRFVDYANTNIFRTFSLYLEMEVRPSQHVDRSKVDVR